MSTSEPQGDPAFLPTHIASDIRQSLQDYPVPIPTESYMAECIAEITLETQIAGASLLTLSVDDNLWMLQASGFLDIDADGLVPIVDINFPPNSNSWWRLCAINGTVDTNSTDPNLTLTFEDRIVSYLREEWGPFVVGQGLMTRAQCVARLVAQVGAKGGQTAGDQKITFVCPSENIIQPIAETITAADSSGTQIVTPAVTSSNKTNKSQGIGVGAALTVKGSPITAQQVAVCNAGLAAGVELNAPLNALEALIYAGMGESSLGNDAGTSENVWQANSPGDYGPSPNWGEMATAFFQGTGNFGNGGAIALANAGHSVVQIANAVEKNAVYLASVGGAADNPNGTGDSYGHEWEGGQAQGLQEATAIVSAYSGGSLDALGTGDSTTDNLTSDVSQLTRGTSDNPDESSWDCIQRLATDVQWFAFSNANTLYYMDGYDLVGQAPSAYIRLIQDNGPRWGLIDGQAAHSSEMQMDVVASLNYTFDNALALDTPLPTPSGWTTMGEVKGGDWLIGADGHSTRVVGTSPVQHDHDCYRVTFDDGTSIVADAGHLWRTRCYHTAGQRARGGKLRTVTTEQIAAQVRNPNGYSHRIQVADPLELPAVDLPIDPYVLGYWLGDGSKNAPLISTHHDDVASLAREIRRAGYHCNVRHYANKGSSWSRAAEHTSVTFSLSARRATRHDDSMTRRLRQLGVLGDKHIPDAYMRSSRTQRLALLQGLMDADGTIGSRSRCEFAQTNERLAYKVLELIRSLGFKPYIKWLAPRGQSKRQARIHFASMPHANPFRLWRKADRYMQNLSHLRRGTSAHLRSVVAVVPVDSVPVKCIKVEAADHLFLAGEGMVPTRNTAFIYRSTHKRRGRIQRKSRIATPQTPSEIQLNLVCDYDQYRAGDVFVFQDAGPINGRWIISDATRNCLGDTFTQFTLEPPIAPSPEPAATGSSSSTSVVAASGGVVSSGGTSGSISGYVNPLSKISNLTPLRIDQGVDYSGTGQLLAIGNATIDLVYPLGGGSGWPGGGWVTYTLSNGPFAGKMIYIAENISPHVTQGQTVQAGDVLATLIDGSPNLETGWASGQGTLPLAAQLGQNAVQNDQSTDPGGHASACGNNFNQLLMALGAPSGTYNGTPNGTMPAGWPKITSGGATGGGGGGSSAQSAAAADAQSHLRGMEGETTSTPAFPPQGS